MSQLEVTVTPSDPENHLKRKDFSYLHVKIFEVAKEIQSDSSLFKSLIHDLETDDEASELNVYCGRIFKEAHKIKMDEESILFSPLNSSAKLKLDLSRVGDFSFFPGQMIAFRGTLDQKLVVYQILDDQLPLLPFPEPNFNFQDKLKICVISGPFPEELTTGSVQKLCTNLTAFEPDVLILLGPFVDENDPDLPKRTKMDEYLLNLIRVLREACPPVTFLLVPSQFDFTNENVIPSPPFDIQPESLGPNVHCLSNPCFVNVLGVHFAITSCDILMHLVREEFNRTTNISEGRMNRLCKHLIRQRSLYPMFPAAQDTNVDWTFYRHLKMPVMPHFLIVPSVLKGFVFEEFGITCLNPETIRKGTFATIEVDKSKITEGATSLSSAVTTQLSKLE